tara:strand:- start:131 stop:544 length:414 start_codon:yes stop_codon:yes gene_type:complete
MKTIYSKIIKKPIHIVFYKKDFDIRKDLVDPSEFIQVASLKLNNKQTFHPHKHKWKKSVNNNVIAQESWVIIRGSVKVDYYDTDNKFLQNEILKSGDCTITLEGGHNYTSLSKDTLVYEFKTGPYFGFELDKELIQV